MRDNFRAFLFYKPMVFIPPDEVTQRALIVSGNIIQEDLNKTPRG